MSADETRSDAASQTEPELELRALVQNDLDEGPVGIFPTWRAVYVTVIVYALGTVVLLYLVSLAMDFSAG